MKKESIAKIVCTSLFVLLSFLTISAQSKGHKVSGTYVNISFENLIDSLRAKSGVEISYDVNSIPVDSVISITFSHADVFELLTNLLDLNQVEILDKEGQIIIRHKLFLRKSNVITLSGHIHDHKGNPLPLVNIGLKGRALGTISNDNGEFDFVISRQFYRDTVLFSSLGFAMGRAIVPANDSILEVILLETSVPLPEVMIRYKNVDEIIQSFIKNREVNYLDSAVVLNAFFRESIKQNDQFVDVSEAVLEIMKFSYLNQAQVERVKFIKGRKSSDVEKMKDVDFRLEGGPYHFSRIDMARYMDFFPTGDGEHTYDYKLEGIDYEYDRPVFVVFFKPIDDTGKLLYNGHLRIDVESFALISANFELTKNTLRKSRKYLIRKESGDIKARPIYARYSINYRPYQERWVLNKVRGEIEVQVDDRNKKNKSVFYARTEMVISDFYDAKGVRFKSSELYKPKYVLADKINEFDPDFWKDYNIIKPNEELERVFKSKKGKP